jgi:hypothetical protein
MFAKCNLRYGAFSDQILIICAIIYNKFHVRAIMKGFVIVSFLLLSILFACYSFAETFPYDNSERDNKSVNRPINLNELGCIDQNISSFYKLNSTIARRGCCSHHQGVCGCQYDRAVCCDGSLSPSCGCD